MHTPVISVLMSVFKEPIEWIKEAIDSILTQTYKDFEFIIVNDNPSSVELESFLKRYKEKDNRIKIIQNIQNLGLTKSLNIGIDHCGGKYIARMDADDISYPNRFEIQLKFMESNPDVIVCGTKIKPFGYKTALYCDQLFEHDFDIRGQLIHNSGFAHPTVFIRRETLINNKISYDETYITAQDYKLWYDLRNLGKYANINKKLLRYRYSNKQITFTKQNDQTDNKNRIKQLFKDEYLEKLKVSQTNIKDTTYKRYESYLMREIIYNTGSILSALKLLFNYRTAISYKEKLFLILISLKRNF